MKKDQPKISIVFINWNGKKDTFKLLESLSKINYENFDVIVIDDASTQDISVDFEKKWSGFATLLKNKKPLGYAESTNICIKEAMKRKSKYILSMNNDMIVDKNFLNILVDSMEKHPEVAVSTPMIYYMKPKNMIWCAGCKRTIRGFKPLNQREIDKGQVGGEKYVDACDCVLMLRTKALKDIGLFDKSFFLIHELTELCLRATKKGYKCLFVPDSKVWHKVSASITKNNIGNEKTTYFTIRNWLLTVKRNESFFRFLVALFLELTFLAFIRFIKYAKNNNLKLIKTYYIAIWHALIDYTPLEAYPFKENKR